MKLSTVILAIIFLLMLSGGTIVSILSDWFWFQSVGYEQVFLTILLNNIGLGLLAFLTLFLFAMLNIAVARRRSRRKKGKEKARKRDYRMTGLLLATLLISLFIGSLFANWEVVLRYLNSVPFGVQDPVFGMDIGFYVFELPFLSYLFSFALITLIITALLTFLTYLLYSAPERKLEELDDTGVVVPSYSFDMSSIKKKATPHLSILLAMLFAVLSFGFTLAEYSVLFSTLGVVFGAGYTAINIALPALMLLSFVSAVIGIIFLANIRLKRWRFVLEGVAILLAIGILGGIVSGVIQGFVVAPNEFNLEKPYLERNIQATLDAFGLQGVTESEFPVSYDLRLQDIQQNQETISNIRLWDFRPLMSTYEQLQLFRTYYDFRDVDIDRYDIEGNPTQVMVSPREMDVNQLSSEAQTWVNRHLVFTHGYGIVMNPVNDVSSEGLPVFYIQDIPPKSPYFNITRPEIYFGEAAMEYAVVKTTTEELNYPQGNKNVFTSYEGDDGVLLSPIKKLIYAIKFGSVELLFSSSLTADSRILMNRNIHNRVRTIAPFLRYDRDPYIVASDGRLFWMLDAYTVSDKYPYSTPISTGTMGTFNYIRNPVKVVIDAYNGDVKFYVIDPNDPIIQTYSEIFPGTFLPFSDMPQGLVDHIRYPEDLFTVQKEVYSTFHMTDPNVFYNKEDVWVTPFEILRGSKQEVIPYFIIMKIPDKESEEFIIMIPFSPRGKDNMIAWMAASSDPENYGNLTVFTFSKQELVFGPLQIEARIDQNTDISQLFTLWGQSGSSVVRGNTLVIPVEDSILYVEPVFLVATEKGTVPELKRIIVAYSDKLTMQPTLQESLDVIFGAAPPSGPVTPSPGETPQEILDQIADLYQKAQDALRNGDLPGYANYIEQIGSLLQQ